jgi:hypothetical protein
LVGSQTELLNKREPQGFGISILRVVCLCFAREFHSERVTVIGLPKGVDLIGRASRGPDDDRFLVRVLATLVREFPDLLPDAGTGSLGVLRLRYHPTRRIMRRPT